jgi:hypothetical protein
VIKTQGMALISNFGYYYSEENTHFIYQKYCTMHLNKRSGLIVGQV